MFQVVEAFVVTNENAGDLPEANINGLSETIHSPFEPLKAFFCLDLHSREKFDGLSQTFEPFFHAFLCHYFLPDADTLYVALRMVKKFIRCGISHLRAATYKSAKEHSKTWTCRQRIPQPWR
jgi:hypothetical protein